MFDVTPTSSWDDPVKSTPLADLMAMRERLLNPAIVRPTLIGDDLSAMLERRHQAINAFLEEQGFDPETQTCLVYRTGGNPGEIEELAVIVPEDEVEEHRCRAVNLDRLKARYSTRVIVSRP